jgi:hypothetical protein
MGWLIIKYLITAAIIVGVSEVAKRNEKLGVLLVTLRWQSSELPRFC